MEDTLVEKSKGEDVLTKYTREEIYEATLDYFKGDTLATEVWINKYCLKDSAGNLYEKTPDDMHRRLARELARIEGKYENPISEKTIYNKIKNFKKIIPQGSPMSGIGNDFQTTSIGNCLHGDTKVLTRKGYKKIKTLKNTTQTIMTKGGGWVDAPFKSYGEQNLYKIKLKKGKTGTKEIFCTKDHDWFIKRPTNKTKLIKISTLELKIGDKLHNQYGKGYGTTKPSPFGITHGITFGDGSTDNNLDFANSIVLCGDSRELSKYFINESVSTNELLCDGGSDRYGSLPNYYREKPNISENRSYLYGWLCGYFAADGNIDERGSAAIHSVNRSNIEFILDVCGILGIGCSEIQNQTVISNLTNKEHTMYKCFIHTNHLSEDFFLLNKHKSRFKKTNKTPNKWEIVEIIKTDKTEEVFCGEVPNTHSFVIDNNILTGNCFVIGNDADSYGGIFKLDQEQAQLMKRRGGVGIDLSHIRPKESNVNNSALTSTGIVPFMERFSNTTREVAQSGRRGALMESISIKHPDSEEFIDAKLDGTKVTGANISIKLDDEFMIAAMDGTTYTQQYPVDLHPLAVPITTKEVNASKIWKKIIHNAWDKAEPGVFFWDKVKNESIPSCYGKEWIETTSNPCGELPLPPYDSCRLLAINLFGYVVNPFTKDSYFDWKSFEEDVILAERFMDDIVDLELEKIDKILIKIDGDPEEENIKNVEKNLWENIRRKAELGRRTGLGITGEGDMLAALGFKYGTDEATDFSVKVHKTLKLKAYYSSVIMAKERGAFPIYDSEREENNPFILRIKDEDLDLYDMMVKYGRRNLALLTIAPTGTVSLMTQTTSGIEPVYLVSYKRRRKINPQEKNMRIDFTDEVGDSWMEYAVFHHNFKLWMEVNDYDVTEVQNMSEVDISEIIKVSPYFGATANDVDWVKKVEMQGKIQKEIDHSISVTVNLPKDVTEEIVSKVYETGWRSGCKGITVYRDGSRSGVLISDTEKEQQKKDDLFKDNHAPKRPKRLRGEILRFQNNLEKWIAVVGMMEGRPYEVFTGKLENGLSELPTSLTECEIVKMKNEDGTTRYDIEYFDSNNDKKEHTGLNHTFNPEYWNYAKMISSVMRHGMPIIYILDLINSLNLNDEHLNTWKNGVARVLKKYIRDGEKGNGTCPSCGSENLEYKEGCLTCVSCGNSKCS